MNNLTAVKINSKIIWFLTIGALLVLGYFIFKGFFSTNEADLTSTNNTFVNATEQAKLVDILNKENLSFKNSITDMNILKDTEDFSVAIDSSYSSGRENPFIP